MEKKLRKREREREMHVKRTSYFRFILFSPFRYCNLMDDVYPPYNEQPTYYVYFYITLHNGYVYEDTRYMFMTTHDTIFSWDIIPTNIT